MIAIARHRAKTSVGARRSVTLALLVTPCMLVPRAEAQDTTFKTSGDFRLRYENNRNLLPEPARFIDNTRSRAVVRFRGGITKNINEYIGFGARLTTGNPNDPNTADVTLGSFLNDLAVSLDRAYVDLRYENLYGTGGKFANPFRRTDLVWDGDVNPQGFAASYSLKRAERFTPKLTGMFFIIDEFSTDGIKDSRMGGGQLEFDFKPNSDLGLTVAGAYYDYDIQNLGSGLLGGDARSNNVNVEFDDEGNIVPPITYVSDFDLLDIIGVVHHRGFNERFPIRLVGDYVKNLGAKRVSPDARLEDQGFMIDLFLGKTSRKHDTRFRYGYAQCETDAVLAAFSNDNTTIPTNYEQHTLTADYVLLDDTTLNVTWYYHRELHNGDPARDGWVSRLRLNAVVRF